MRRISLQIEDLGVTPTATPADIVDLGGKPGYRPDIDGLRAIAIVSVVFFHFFPQALPGGFIGVDIFFVISGFLIGGIILEGLQRGNFSFRNFYAGRVRRIFPALILVLSCTYVCGWFILMPEEFAQLGKHVAGGIGFSDNFVLWREAGYFDRATALKPLMHLWSLGIEEQFYLAFPALLWALWHWRNNICTVLWILAGVSFLANLYFLSDDPVATFFLPQFRIWELLAGACLASSQLRSTQGKKGRWQDITSLAGLLLLGMGLVFVDEAAPFPGWRALLPIGGAFLLIAAGPQALVNRRLLAHPLSVWIGLISYPLYLWHWPLLSYANIIGYDGVAVHWRAVLIVASVLLAWLTYRVIEKPVRFGRKHWGITAVLVCLGFFIGFLGFNTFQREGMAFRHAWEFRYPKVLRSVLSPKFDDDRYFRAGTCHLRNNQGPEAFSPICSDDGRAGKPSLFLWGDSHAAHLYPGLQQHFSELRLMQYTAPACEPIVGSEACRQVNDYILEKVRELKPDRVVLASRWRAVDQTEKISNTIRQIRAAGVKEIIIIGPVPRWRPDLMANLLKIYQTTRFTHVPERLGKGLDTEKFVIDRALAKLAKDNGALYISSMALLCNTDGCLVQPKRQEFAHALMVFDDSHLTPEGSRYFVGLLKEPSLLNAKWLGENSVNGTFSLGH